MSISKIQSFTQWLNEGYELPKDVPFEDWKRRAKNIRRERIEKIASAIGVTRVTILNIEKGDFMKEIYLHNIVHCAAKPLVFQYRGDYFLVQP